MVNVVEVDADAGSLCGGATFVGKDRGMWA